MSNFMRASSKALKPHSHAESFSGSGLRYATRNGATISASPTTSATLMKITMGRYELRSSLMVVFRWPSPGQVYSTEPGQHRDKFSGEARCGKGLLQRGEG